MVAVASGTGQRREGSGRQFVSGIAQPPVQIVKSVSAHALNRQLESRGPIWQKVFHDHALRREEDIRRAARYIFANPVRAGLVESVRDFSHWDAVWV